MWTNQRKFWYFEMKKFAESTKIGHIFSKYSRVQKSPLGLKTKFYVLFCTRLQFTNFPINHEIFWFLKDVDPEDVDELVPNNCKFEVTVILSIGPGNHGSVTNVLFNLQREDFEFDTTWFSSHFHDLDQVWSQQETVLTSALKSVITESFESAISFNPPEVWLKNKFRQINQSGDQDRLL